MDLMTLAAKITLDDSSYRQGVNNAEKMGQQLTQKMSAMTVAVGNLVADVVKKSISGIGQIVSGAIDGYADYQQLIGGVETLFKTSSDKVSKYAKQAYKTAGLSANEYMETVTSFSASLLQGLGGDTEAAADLANTAIQDMADNANKMGTDMSSIQAAYQGFAKQNYTMLDNLKLGYGGTASEMVRLINDSGILDHEISSLDDITFDQLVEAIHAVQEQLGITGTTAKEAASTISGSKASLASAWSDLLTAVGGEGDQKRLDETLENFQESFSTYMTNFIPTLVSTIANSGTLVEGIADAIGSLPTDLLSKVAEAGAEAGTDMVGGVSKITSWLIDSIATMFRTASIDPSKVSEFGKAIGDFLGTAIADIVTNAPDIISGIFTVGVNLAGGLLEGLFAGLFGTGSEVDNINKELQSTLFDVDTQTTKADALLKYMGDLAEKYGSAAKKTLEWQTAEEKLEEILQGSGTVFEDYGDDIDGAVKHLQDLNTQLRNAAITNALNKAASAQYELLATQQLAYNTEEARRDRNADMMQTYKQDAVEAIMALAADAAKEYAKTHDNSSPYAKFDQGYYDELIRMSQGKKMVMGQEVSLMGDSLEDLNALSSYNFGEKVASEGTVKAYKEAQDEVTQAEKNMKELQSELDATNESIADLATGLETAIKTLIEGSNDGSEIAEGMTDTAEKVKESGKGAASRISGSGGLVSRALQSVAAKINGAISDLKWSLTPSGGAMLDDEELDWEDIMPRAVGIDYAPNGLIAQLHQGEAILTKKENEERHEGNSYDMEAALQNAIESAMSHIYLNMNGEKVADMTTRRTGKNISANERARVRSMGG